MSAFELGMLLCFGFAWPFSIARSWKSRSTGGKSVVFLFIVIAGYLSGAIHKILYDLDFVVAFYCLNALLVSIDTAIWFRNKRLERETPSQS